MRAQVETAADPLQAAVRVAIAANVIDVGVDDNLREEDIKRSLSQSLADNTGEIVFDRLLVERLTAPRITVALRGVAILNDATLADARVAGLDQVAQVIDNGSDAPGTILRECSAAFRERFASADIIIAKGQGNFETLAGGPGNIFFLLKVKCSVVAAHTGLDIGTHALIENRGRGVR
jgi:hypothetical protein